MPTPENQTAIVPDVCASGHMTVDSGLTSAEGAAASLAAAGREDYDNSFVASMEQIYSPLQITKYPNQASSLMPSVKSVFVPAEEIGNFAHRTQMGGVVPTAEDLDPYFFSAFDDGQSPLLEKSDFVTAASQSDDDPDDPDLTVSKNTGISEIRTVGMRGPLLMSAWGFDIGDKPVPQKEVRWLPNPDYDTSQSSSPSNPLIVPNPDFVPGDTFRFNKDMGADRSLWRSGPVHLLWDRDRQVWSGGLPMLMGVATSDISAPSDPNRPTSFTMQILREAGDEALFPEENQRCSNNNDCPEGFVCSDVSGYCIQDTDNPVLFTPLNVDSSSFEEVTLRNFDPSLSQKMVTKNRERTFLDPENFPDETVPPGAHDWLNNPSLVWVLAIKMNYVWIPFYVGCPNECEIAEHCVSLYKGDPAFEGIVGVDNPANWECSDGDCVFSGDTGDTVGA